MCPQLTPFLCDGLRAVCPSDRGAGPAHSVIDRQRWNPYGGMLEEMAGQQLISSLVSEAPWARSEEMSKIGLILDYAKSDIGASKPEARVYEAGHFR